MAIEFKTPSAVAEEYLLELKSLKPEVNIDQQDSDWWIRGQVVGGVVSGVYQDQRKISDDAFPQSARTEAVERHLFTYFNSGYRAATNATGTVMANGTIGFTLPANTEFLHQPTQNVYRSTEDVLFDAATGAIPVISVDTGQGQNLLEGTALVISSPPSGFGADAVVMDGNISDGRNAETKEEGAARVLSRIRTPVRGGTTEDYETFARDASPSVNGVRIRRFIYGLGTVGIYITAGTADIDQAIDDGDAIVRIPSPELIQTVQDAVDARNPLTDCIFVLEPEEVEQDVTIRVKYAEGYTGASILGGQTLTLNELVQREVSRVLYKLPIGGRVIDGVGYVVGSEIEENLDFKLSATPYIEGEIAGVIVDRAIDDLSISGRNRSLLVNQIVTPGTITVIEE